MILCFLLFLLVGRGSESDPFVNFVTTFVDLMSLEELYAYLSTHEMRIEHSTASTDVMFPSEIVANHLSSQKSRHNNRSTNIGPNGLS
jgi:hypothetical protein